MKHNWRRDAQADRKIPPVAAGFKKILLSLLDGDISFADAEADLHRLIAAGADADDLREVMRRCEAVEPLTDKARQGFLSILDAAPPAEATGDASTPPPGAGATSEAASGHASAATPASESAAAAGSNVDSAALVQRLSALEGRLVKQRAEYRSLTEAYERVRDSGAAAAALVNSTTAKMAVLRVELDDEQGRRLQSEAALAAATAAAAEAREALAEREAALEREARSAAEAPSAASAAQMQSELDAARGRLAALMAELSEARGGLDAERNRVREARQTAADQEAKGDSARARVDELQQEYSQYLAQIRALREANERLTADATASEALLREVAERESAAREAATAEALAKTQPIAAADAAVLQRLGELEAQLAAEQARTLELGADLSEAHARAEQVLRQSEQHQNERRSLRDAVAAREQSIAEGRKALHERDEQLAGMRGAEAAVAARAEELAAEVHKQRAELRALREELTAREVTIREERRSLGERDAELATLQREHAQTVAALEQRAAAADARIAAAQAEAMSTHPAITPHARAVDVSDWDPGDAVNPDAMTVVLEPPLEAPLERGAAKLDADDWRGAKSAWKPNPEAVAASAGATPRRRGTNAGGIVRWVGFAAALALIAAAIWMFVGQTPSASDEPTAPGAPAAPAASGPKAGTVLKDCETCPAFTVMPPGRFKQGSATTEGPSAAFERPLHWVVMHTPYALSQTDITVDQFRAFVTAAHRDMRGCDIYDNKWRFNTDASWEHPGFEQTGAHPVTCVSWEDATAYAAWLSKSTGQHYRLPSASEWEYAAKAGSEALQPWTASADACANANVADKRAADKFRGWAAFACDDGYVYTSPVGSYKANAFGVNDMLGNVFQWTADCWHPDYKGAPTDGGPRSYGDCTERELRGGSWFTNPNLVRATYRNHFAANYRASSVGIRLVREINP